MRNLLIFSLFVSCSVLKYSHYESHESKLSENDQVLIGKIIQSYFKDTLNRPIEGEVFLSDEIVNDHDKYIHQLQKDKNLNDRYGDTLSIVLRDFASRNDALKNGNDLQVIPRIDKEKAENVVIIGSKYFDRYVTIQVFQTDILRPWSSRSPYLIHVYALLRKGGDGTFTVLAHSALEGDAVLKH